jgi:hypothetical protein|tara:strand:+ start:4497 stop:4715 length:219 start_codon:yes stop_codon:yes gene_type:complete
MVNFNKKDYGKWKKFRMVKNNVISRDELEMVSELHAKYHRHTFYIPCTCSPKTINRWIKDLNIIYDNGVKKN